MNNISTYIKFTAIFLALSIIILIIYLGFSVSSRPSFPITLRLNWTIYLEHTPFYVAKDLGYYKQEGIDIDIIPGSGSNITLRTIAKNVGEIGYVNANSIVKGIDEGLPVKSVATFCQHETSSFIFRKDLNIKTIKDLKGKRVALSTGDAQIDHIKNNLVKLGLSPNDLIIKEFPNALMKEQSLIDRTADILIGYYLDQVARLELAYNIPFDYIKYSDYGIDNLSSSIVVSTDFISKHPRLLSAFLRATQKGFLFTRENPQKAAEIFYSNIKTATLDRVRSMLELFIPLFHTPNSEGHPLGWTSNLDWIDTKQKITEKHQKNSNEESLVDIYYTNEFLSEIY